MTNKIVFLKKGRERRVRSGHPWIFSNEIDTQLSPLKTFSAGEEVIVAAHDKTPLGAAYINPHSLIAARIFSRNADEKLDTVFFQNRLRDALLLREQLFEQPFYRWVFGEADGLPGLVIDRFDLDIVVQLNTAGMDIKQNEIAAALRVVLPELRSILLRNDSSIRQQEGLEIEVRALYGTPPETILLEENGARFYAPLWQGQKTGWFYDHRMNRARLKNYVRNKTVLDVFSYLGAWGIQAALYGAKQVDCVESSASACEFIRQNAALNQKENNVQVICDDAFTALKTLLQSGKRYDVIVLDPPAFVKKAKDHKEGLLAYQRINELAIKLLLPGGLLVSCSCSMHVSADDMLAMFQRLAYRTDSRLRLTERGHQGPDHPLHICIPETDYLKAFFLVL